VGKKPILNEQVICSLYRLKLSQKLFVKDFELMIKYCVRLRWLPLN